MSISLSQPIAGVMAVKDYQKDFSAFESLRDLVDIVIVLDNNSALPFEYRAKCDDYLSLRNKSLWHDIGNRTLLMYRAHIHGCKWLVSMDDDIIFSHNFQTRADVLRVIKLLEENQASVGKFVLKDLWGSACQSRIDGLWGQKGFAVIRRNWLGDQNLTFPDPAVRLHNLGLPRNLSKQTMLLKDYTAYHTGCLTHDKRLQRVQKYLQQDPANAFQSDYNYMLDFTGIKLEEIPAVDIEIIKNRWPNAA